MMKRMMERLKRLFQGRESRKPERIRFWYGRGGIISHTNGSDGFQLFHDNDFLDALESRLQGNPIGRYELRENGNLGTLKLMEPYSCLPGSSVCEVCGEPVPPEVIRCENCGSTLNR